MEKDLEYVLLKLSLILERKENMFYNIEVQPY
jgi:hypothetical protein